VILRAWVKVSPLLKSMLKSRIPKTNHQRFRQRGGFGPYIPVEYGGAGLDQISYGLIMQEIERGDSGVRSTSSVNLLVMYQFGNTVMKSNA
jgi:glutaryl-CoA dehydrogenase